MTVYSVTATHGKHCHIVHMTATDIHMAVEDAQAELELYCHCQHSYEAVRVF